MDSKVMPYIWAIDTVVFLCFWGCSRELRDFTAKGYYNCNDVEL